MNVAAEMQPDWKNWEGEIAGGEFPLEQFLGAGEQGAVFRSRIPSGEGAIKLVPARDNQAQRLVDQWNRARTLDHPHLIRILETGTWAKANISVAYVVMEYADENLGEVIAERPLSAGETLEMLQPVAEALAFLHRQGLVHGSLKPSNILAVKDTLKISSDAVSSGDPAGDLQDLVALMVQALTQQPTFAKNGSARTVIDGLPEPFREIAQNRTGQGGRVPWSAAELASWLQTRGEAPSAGAATPRASQPQPGNPRLARNAIVLALILVAVITVGSLLRNRTVDPVSAVPQPSAKTSEPPVASAPPPSPEAKKAEPPAVVIPDTKPIDSPAPARERQPRRVVSDSPEQVVSQVLPDITAKARRTVRGKATVVVKVAVDPSGNVTDASLERGGSRYFGKLAVDAARKWRFVAANGDTPREWFLRFDITPRDTKVFVEKSVER